MAVAETNKIITHGDGQSIATSIQNIADAINDQEKNVHLSDAQTITGAKTFTSPIKTSEIDNTAGNAMLRDKSTEGAIVLGSVSKKAVIMGSGDRPTYSKDGSDFAGSELALKSDVTQTNDIHIFAQSENGEKLLNGLDLSGKNVYIHDERGTFTSVTEMLRDLKAANAYYYGGKGLTSIYEMTHGCDAKINLEIDCTNITSMLWAFRNYTVGTLANVKLTNTANVTNWSGCFQYCWSSPVIPAIDLSGATSLSYFATACAAVTSFLCTGMRVSFSLSDCTKMSQSALRVVIDNLADVSSGTQQTLTLGSTNLAKLTADDITTANNKGWNLA